MQLNQKLILVLALLSSSIGTLWAQPSAVYRDAEEAYKRGMDFYEQGLYGKSIEDFSIAIKDAEIAEQHDIVPFVQEAKLYRGMAGMRLAQPDAENQILSLIAETDPDPIATKARFELAGFYFNQREYAKSLVYYNQISTVDLDNTAITQLRFKQGYAYFVTRDFQKARKSFGEIINIKDKYYYPSNYYYGTSAFFLNDYNEALVGFERVTTSQQYSRVVPYYITQIYFARKQYKEVIAYGEPLLNDGAMRNRTEIGQLVGQSYFELGDYKNALPYMENYVKNTDKVSKEILYQLGLTQMENENYAAAIENFNQLSSLKEVIGQHALYNLGACYLKTNNKLGARASFQEAASMSYDPKVKADAHFLYSKLSAELKYDSEAIKGLQEIPSTSPYYNEAQELLGEVFINTRDYDKALGILRAMNPLPTKMKETYQKVAYFNGVQKYVDGDKKQANDLFEESLKYPVDASFAALANFRKAEYAYYTNDHSGAITYYNKYLSLAPSSSKNIPENASTGVAYYGLGYSYLQKKDYNNAARNFVKTVEEIEAKLKSFKDLYVVNQVYPDATLRAADCYLMINKYSDASKYYDKAVNAKHPNADYATYQQALILGLQRKPDQQITKLESLTKSFPKSIYADDALFRLGEIYTAMGKGKEGLAISSLEKLITGYKESDLYNKALIQLGLVYFNVEPQQLDKSLEYYKKVFDNNPNAEDAQSALRAIEEIYVEKGDPDGYFEFVSKVPNIELSDVDRDMLTFNAAEKPFGNEDYPKAISSLTDYINKFPKGINILKARYLRGFAYQQQKKYAEAVTDYDFVLSKGKSEYAPLAAVDAANLSEMELKDPAKAYGYFVQLDMFASDNPELQLDARRGALRTAYATNKKEVIYTLADKLIKTPGATNDDKASAYFYIAKVAFDQRKLDEALLSFNEVLKLDKASAMAAEALYSVASVYYQKRDLATAESKAMSAGQAFPQHKYWLAKNFILLADIYTEQNKILQAKSTLKAVVSSFSSFTDLVDEAKRKLALLESAEKSNSRIAPDNPDGLLEMDDNN
jgi:tetratricopeptide (TPR) repeat protein